MRGTAYFSIGRGWVLRGAKMLRMENEGEDILVGRTVGLVVVSVVFVA